MKVALLVLVLINIALGEPNLPLIKVHQVQSFDDVPSIDITFPNGQTDSLVLERYYPTRQARLERRRSCLFVGHLKNENTAGVAVTGCAGQDDLLFTINSKNSGPSNMYILRKEGPLELVESVFKVCTVFLQ